MSRLKRSREEKRIHVGEHSFSRILDKDAQSHEYRNVRSGNGTWLGKELCTWVDSKVNDIQAVVSLGNHYVKMELIYRG